MEISIAIKNNLIAVFKTLKRGELNEDEKKYYLENLGELKEFLPIFAAAFKRTKTLASLKIEHGLSLHKFEQWMQGEKIEHEDTVKNVITKEGIVEKYTPVIPTFDDLICNARNDVEYLSCLSQCTKKSRDLVIDKLANLVNLNDLTQKYFPEISQLKIKKFDQIHGRDAYALIEAIKSNNVSFVQQYSSQCSLALKEYGLILAASLQHTDIMQVLIDRLHTPTEKLSLWMFGKKTSMLQDPLLPDVANIKSILTKDGLKLNEPYIAYLERFLVAEGKSKLSTEQQLDLVHAAVQKDNLELLAMLVERLKCIWEPKNYNWESEHNYITTYEKEVDDYNSNMEIVGTTTEYKNVTIFHPAKEHLEYKSALFMAADREKERTLTWLLAHTADWKVKSIERLEDMARTRPILRSCLDDVTKQSEYLTVMKCASSLGNSKDVLAGAIEVLKHVDRVPDAIDYLKKALQNHFYGYYHHQWDWTKLRELSALYSEKRAYINHASKKDFVTFMDELNLIAHAADNSLNEEQKKQLKQLATNSSECINALLNIILKRDDLEMFKYFSSCYDRKVKYMAPEAAEADAGSIVEYIFSQCEKKPWDDVIKINKDGKHPKLRAFLLKEIDPPNLTSSNQFGFFAPSMSEVSRTLSAKSNNDQGYVADEKAQRSLT
ncbi:hypothetical protein Lgra_0784 [Legionella gratiana]|uniref:Uncharacterized protein n=1 Tax=Legionella gratiana TaxID=45066 RepID=A0A378JMR6_9GAMM|nr:hypothetical protein [Legionella gratiana]KTD13649.1 hypothetical protein Lgra_0784 [Legionella gratiana]STX46040.1 Uncharacterised protein [Legionella gratiana]